MHWFDVRAFRWALFVGLVVSGGCDSPTGPSSAPITYAVGQSEGGGVIFYVDDSGEHGLIAAPGDQASNVDWFNGSYVVTGAIGTGIGTGQANTVAIVGAQGAGTYAASLCDQLELNGFSDWFLPSKDELDALFLQKAQVGGFTEGFYWSSTEHGEGSAWEQLFNTGVQYYANKNFPIHVRAIRAF